MCVYLFGNFAWSSNQFWTSTCVKMNSIAKLLIFIGSISCCTISVLAYNSTTSAQFTGLLNDILQTNQQQDLGITTLCNQELISIQTGLDLRDVWAIKCKWLDKKKKKTILWNQRFMSILCLTVKVHFQIDIKYM